MTEELLERAADMLASYAELIRRDGASHVEEHHYLPEVEFTAKELRALAAPSVPSGEPADALWLADVLESFRTCNHATEDGTPLHLAAAAELRRLHGIAQPAPAGWRPIETAPQTGCKIILAYLNRNGKPRTVMARWLTDEQAAETDGDGVGLEGGWYECIDNWDDYTEVAIHEGEPSHWMPLPAAPTVKDSLTIPAAPVAPGGEG